MTKRAVLIVLTFTLIFFWKVIIKNLIPLPADLLAGVYDPWKSHFLSDYPVGVAFKHGELSDSISQFYPWKAFWKNSISNGEIPLWNPLIMSGIPFAATLHSAVFYPLNIFFAVLSTKTAWSLYVMSQLFLSMFFMYLYLKEIKVSFWASIFGSIAFGLSGYMMQWFEFGPGSHAGLWLPLILFAVEKTIRKNSFFWVAVGAISISLSILAGDFQSTFYAVLLSIAYSIFRLFSINKDKKLFKTANYIGLIFIFGILLASLQIIPTAELYPLSIRGNDIYSDVNFGILSWEKLILFFAPDFFGNPATGNWFGQHYYFGSVSYIGVSTLIFSIFSILFSKRKIVKFYLFVLIISLLFIYPTFIAFLPYKLNIPVLRTLSANRMLYLTSFIIPILASLGIDWLQNINLKEYKHKIYAVIATLITLISIFMLFIYFNYSSTKSAESLIMLRNLVLPIILLFITTFFIFIYTINPKKIIFLIFTLVLFADLYRFGHKYMPFSEKKFVFPSTEVTDFLVKQDKPFRVTGDIPDNFLMVYGIESIEGYESIYIQKYSQFNAIINNQSLSGGPGRYVDQQSYDNKLFNLLNVKYVIRSSNQSIENKNLRNVLESEGLIIYENIESLPRAFVAGDYIISEKEHVIDNLLNDDIDVAKTAVLVEDPKLGDLAKNVTFPEPELLEQNINKISYKIDMPSPGIFVLSQNYYPGWRVYINGNLGKIYNADYALVAVPLSSGEYKLDFVYEPISFKIGLLLTCLAFATLSLLLFYEKYRKNSGTAA